MPDKGTLDWDHHGVLHGREAELAQLHHIYQRVLAGGEEVDSQILLIAGYAGTGKSTLIDVFRTEVTRNQDHDQNSVFFLTGKYEERLTMDPFAPISDAIAEYCGLLGRNESDLHREAIRRKLLAKLGCEGRALTDRIPALLHLLGSQPDLPEVSVVNSTNRANYHFRSFFEVICSESQTIILFLDDLQWADAASLELVFSLTTDVQLTHFLFIGAFRENEVGPEHPLIQRLRTMARMGRNYTMLMLGNLPHDALQQYVADTLQMNRGNVESLVEVILTKTHGNAYFVRAFLLFLEQTGLLQYSSIKGLWVWELPLIQKLSVTINVVDMTIQSLQQLPIALQKALMVAAFLRSSFDLMTLQQLIPSPEQVGDCGLSRDHVKALAHLFKAAVTGGFLEYSEDTQKYRFIHDRVRQAAFSLAKTNENQKLTLHIGKTLVKLSNLPSGEDWMLFAGIDHLNSLPSFTIQREIGLIRLIELNHQAGLCASTRSAFSAAYVYLKNAITMLQSIRARWDSHYDLCLDLYHITGKVCFGVGRFDEGHSLLTEILVEARESRDKLQAYTSLAEGYGQKEQHRESLRTLQQAIKIVEKLPRTWIAFHIMRDISFLKCKMNTMTDEEILARPLMSDKDKLLAVRLLSQMWLRAYLCNEVFLSCFYMTRAASMTLDHGLSAHGAYSFAAVSSILFGPLNDVELGLRFGRLSRKSYELTGGKELESRIMLTFGCFINPWIVSLSENQETLQRGFMSGMESGDFEFGLFNGLFYNIHAFLIGRKLHLILCETEPLIKEVDKSGQNSVAVVLAPFHHMILDLAGQSQNPMQWVDQAEVNCLLNQSYRDPSDSPKIIWTCLAWGQVAFFFGQFKVAYQIWWKLRPLVVLHLSFSTSTLFHYFGVLITSAMYRETGDRLYQRKCKEALKSFRLVLQKFDQAGNASNRFRIACAAYSAACDELYCSTKLRKTPEEIRREFDKTIRVACMTGRLHDAALASELCAEYFFSIGDEFWARTYFFQSYELYVDWGAQGKANNLLQTRGQFISLSPC